MQTVPQCNASRQINGEEVKARKDRINVWMNGSLELIASGAQIERFPKSPTSCVCVCVYVCVCVSWLVHRESEPSEASGTERLASLCVASHLLLPP